MLRVQVDFNTLTEDRKRVRINERVHSDLLDQLRAGTRIACYQDEDDFEVEGIIEIDQDQDGTQWWFVRLDWSTRRDLA